MKIDRLIEILMMLINENKITATKLANYFNVSVRTIQRDIDSLCMAGIPIFATVGKTGGYELLKNYKIDKSFLNKNEATTLVAFLKALSSTVPNQEMKSLFNKLSVLYPNNHNQNKVVIKLNPHVDEKHFNHLLQKLTTALENELKLKLTYIDSNLKKTTRTIAPQTIVMMGSAWYIYGYCFLREHYRVFKINRIVDCTVISEQFNKQSLPYQTEEELPWHNNMDSKRANTTIQLELDKCMLARIPDYFSYKNCKIVKDKILINIAYPVDEWLYSLFLSLVPFIKILKPEWVKQEFFNRLQCGLNKNK
ncbi:YafY family transcriptional regulator [Clostridium sp. 'deep sea']|uniref:helix-turn-helix transcriptional regulator n=1 Tax=Clostridium sp. 'deep sea' TaxID=2779445 RepID=UPI00189688A9|nr:YafY family protein [Clostridium sp. 'deep sea']QOR35020.1 YafY family transcriptional regulator [Clostridium sp. 'deep sea']